MKKKCLKYIFHDANPPEITAEKIMEIFTKSNIKKIESAIHKNVDKEAV